MFVCENVFSYTNIATYLFASAFFQLGHSTQTSFAEKSDDLFFGYADGVKAQASADGSAARGVSSRAVRSVRVRFMVVFLLTLTE
jgi:hypothetical protein